jgi:hypothetical protein
LPKYIVVDALLNETGIRDEYTGIYFEPASLGLSSQLQVEIAEWLERYQESHFKGYPDDQAIEQLDEWGERIAHSVKKELIDSKVSYYSDARSTKKRLI